MVPPRGEQLGCVSSSSLVRGTPGVVNFQLFCPSSPRIPRPLEHLQVGSCGLDGTVYGWPPGWAQGSLGRGSILAPASKQTPAFAQMNRVESGGGRWQASSRDQQLCFSQKEMGQQPYLWAAPHTSGLGPHSSHRNLLDSSSSAQNQAQETGKCFFPGPWVAWIKFTVIRRKCGAQLCMNLQWPHS